MQIEETSIGSEVSSEVETSTEQVEETTTAYEETTVAYEDTIQYDVNYNFGFTAVWLGCIFGVLCFIAFCKGISK